MIEWRFWRKAWGSWEMGLLVEWGAKREEMK